MRSLEPSLVLLVHNPCNAINACVDMQEQAEADRDGVRVPKEVVWVSDRAEPEAAKGSGGTEGYEGGSPHCPFPSHFPAPPCFHPHHVSPL